MALPSWHSSGQLGLDCLAWLLEGSAGLPALHRCVVSPFLGTLPPIFHFLCEPLEIDAVCIGVSFFQMEKLHLEE